MRTGQTRKGNVLSDDLIKSKYEILRKHYELANDMGMLELEKAKSTHR